MRTKTDRLTRRQSELEYSDSGGDAQSVILTHGAGLNRTMFDEQAEALCNSGFRVITWDLPGHGGSHLNDGARFTAEDAAAGLDALIDELGLDRPVLIGHSLGGNLSQAFVRDNPDRAGGLIILDSTWNTGPLSSTELFLLRMAAPVLSLIPATALPAMMARASALTEQGIAASKELFSQVPKPVFLDVWRATTSFVAPDPSYRTPVRLALIRGANDRTGNIASAMSRWASTEEARDCVITNAGHNVTLDSSAATSAEILRTLRQWFG